MLRNSPTHWLPETLISGMESGVRQLSKRKTVDEIIKATAQEAAQEVVHQQRQARNLNLYRATERLLRNFKAYKRMVDEPDTYGFEPVEKSHDISVAPPPGSSVRDKMDIYEDYVKARRDSYARTLARFEEIAAVVRQFEDKPEFAVIRMYYFNEDVHGNDRPVDADLYSFEEIAEELKSIGIDRNIKTIRSWRTKLVQDMTVMLFGVDGALSVEAREPKQGQKQEGGKADE